MVCSSIKLRLKIVVGAGVQWRTSDMPQDPSASGGFQLPNLHRNVRSEREATVSTLHTNSHQCGRCECRLHGDREGPRGCQDCGLPHHALVLQDCPEALVHRDCVHHGSSQDCLCDAHLGCFWRGCAESHCYHSCCCGQLGSLP